ncbi:MAG TPA: hypothetical protein VMG12_28965, partial [Polyangiaceae bacterium]|nr:hypothetical protein [Polyangiaceae bacterium]
TSDARVTKTFGEVARVLRAGGDFVLFALGLHQGGQSEATVSSENPCEAGVAAFDLAQLARSHGFELVASGERAPQLPDVVSHRLRRRA